MLLIKNLLINGQVNSFPHSWILLYNFQIWFGVGFEENERRRAGNEEDESGGEGSHGQVAICS